MSGCLQLVSWALLWPADVGALTMAKPPPCCPATCMQPASAPFQRIRLLQLRRCCPPARASSWSCGRPRAYGGQGGCTWWNMEVGQA